MFDCKSFHVFSLVWEACHLTCFCKDNKNILQL
nr:MAG TPA: hypothetical protein [Myoviridae sp. ctiIS8]DAO78862.1 MAG TPA: hypothetical protein [Caudoviricetes sp.]